MKNDTLIRPIEKLCLDTGSARNYQEVSGILVGSARNPSGSARNSGYKVPGFHQEVPGVPGIKYQESTRKYQEFLV